MLNRSLLVFLITAAATIGLAQEPSKIQAPTLTPQTSGTTQLLIAVSPVNSQVVWAAGTGGTYVVTTDGGNTWRAGVVPGTDQLHTPVGNSFFSSSHCASVNRPFGNW